MNSDVLRDLELDKCVKALEIGCGVGRLLRPLASRVASVGGVDISAEMVARARRALVGVPNATALVTAGDLSAFGDATLDFVYSFIVFQHIPAKRLVSVYIREAARVLKSHGVFRFQVDGRPRWLLSSVDTWRGVWFDRNELDRELSANGFEVVSTWGEATHYYWITAVRRDEPGRPATRAMRVLRRNWNRRAVDGFLKRIDGLKADTAEDVLAGEIALRRLLGRFLKRHRRLSPEEFVGAAYRTILGREPDPEGLAFYASEITNGTSPANTIDCLVASQELEDTLRPVSVADGIVPRTAAALDAVAGIFTARLEDGIRRD